MTRSLCLVWLLLVVIAPAIPAAMQAQPTQQEEFVPIDQLPPEDQLPAAPLLVAAYALVWLAVLFYLWTLWRRLTSVEKELVNVSRRLQSRE